LPRFVVQEHDATTRHFDLRIEVGGVLVSWAVPKGPSLDPAQKRLAVRVPDHALGHADVEGMVGGARGSGAVIVWDSGEYVAEGDVAAALERGHVALVLRGEKLRGRFALTRTAPGGGARGAGREQWLLVKARDDEARRGSDVVAEAPRSVLSGRTLDEVAAEAGAV